MLVRPRSSSKASLSTQRRNRNIGVLRYFYGNVVFLGGYVSFLQAPQGNYENGRQGNHWLESRNRFQKDDRRFNDRGYQFRNGGQKDDFSRRDHRNRGSSGNFSRGDRRQRGRLNVLKVSDVQSDQTQLANEVPIQLSAICMSPVELPYIPILLNDTLQKHYGTQARRSHLYRRGHTENIFYKQVKKSRTQVITAQGAKCQNIGIVELKVQIREFDKPWLFHVLADLEYPCILGVDFISGSKIILDFDRKSLVIPDWQIDTVVKTVEEGNVEIDLSKTSLEGKQKQQLGDLFNSFKGLFSDKSGFIS
ncbi:uncharacterized protein TNCV_226861 [Trichonephila clavipes]|nr:uncharacterized protein TNCV_226861 [Trichonephila clavipes]